MEVAMRTWAKAAAMVVGLCSWALSDTNRTRGRLPMLRNRSPFCVAILVAVLALPRPVFAHNESVHQRMTDFAYHVMLAAANYSDGGEMSPRLRALLRGLALANPALDAFYADTSAAVPKLRALKSG